ncbi:unnamed protein product [Aureobasidium uvarum]|uniref:Uncharacterized protein n=1 Tax=Aureobasidium uvarum TaxID=2773716 RepID=A0A9N8KDT1_9PEZI|nr:unnamed protein product [Aureobasidium uvarum]
MTNKMTKELLRWEDSPGLEHHCPKCQTPLNNPRAKHTCYLKHVEVCRLFHQHFFMIGQAHNCDTCRRNNSAHNERHRQLALLLRQLVQLQQEQGIEPSGCSGSPFSPTSKRASISSFADNDPETIPKLKKRERKKAKKRIKALRGGDALTTAEVAVVEAALHPPSRNNSTSSASSSSTNAPESSSQSTDSDDSEPIPASPTSPTSPMSPATPITENPSFASLMNANKAFHPDVNGKLNSTRMALQTKLLSVLDETYPPLDVSVENAMHALNITDNDAKTPKCIAELVAKIKEAIKEDLFCAECDVRKFRLREAGWYRFVNRSVLALREE